MSATEQENARLRRAFEFLERAFAGAEEPLTDYSCGLHDNQRATLAWLRARMEGRPVGAEEKLKAR